MLRANARYRMVAISYYDDDRASRWRDVPEFIDSSLLIGDRFGILMLKLLCECGHNTTFYTFFLNNPDDHIVSSCIQDIEGRLHVQLPLCGCEGLYQSDAFVKPVDDAYILSKLARTEMSLSCKLIYESIERDLLKKTAWKRIRRITAQMKRLKREKWANARMVALQVLMRWIPEPELRKQIVRSADLW